MKTTFVLAMILSANAMATDSKEFLIDVGTSGYFTATHVSSGENELMELTDTQNRKYLVPTKNCKVIAERTSSINGFDQNEKVLYTYTGSTADVTHAATIKKLFSNGDALIFVKNYKTQGYHPYLFVDTKTLSRKY